jgi:ribosomal protein S14
MTIAPRCADKQCRGRFLPANYGPGQTSVACPRCRSPISIELEVDSAQLKDLKKCPICGGQEFFIRKDFPQRLGLMLVVIFGVVATIFYYRENIVATCATLFGLVVIDAAIYLFVGKVTVCYKCRAEFRQVAYNPDHGGFDLATSEKYD